MIDTRTPVLRRRDSASRRLVALAFASLLVAALGPGLAGCASGGDPPRRDVEVAGGAIALDLPPGWERSADPVDAPIVLFAEGPGEDQHLMVSMLEGEGAAEQQAIRAVVGYIEVHGLPCRRLDDNPVWDGPVFDCPDETRRPWMHKVLVPIPGDGVSALLLVQPVADDLEEAAALVKPVVDSFVWAHA